MLIDNRGASQLLNYSASLVVTTSPYPMPKRSNDFQRLVKIIHEAISKVEGASVTESAMLPEPDGTLREIDILLERKIADIPLRLAIECRDRSRKSDVDWIDGLIGKFRSLKIDKIVAVCRKGFSAAATAKAVANNIDLRVLTECLTHEWTSEFMRLGIAQFEFQPEFRSVEITLNPPEVQGIELTTIVETIHALAAPRTLEQVVIACFAENVAPRIKQHVEQEFLAKLLPLADLTRTWEFTVPVEIRDIWVLSKAGTRHSVEQMLFTVAGQSRTQVAPVRHFQYGSTALASEAKLNAGTNTHNMSVVQVAGQNSLIVTLSLLK